MNPFETNSLAKKILKLKTFGSSMEPILIDGDIVYIRHKGFAKLETNDVIVLKKNRKIFTHRIIYKSEKYLVTRGDNNSNSDGFIRPKNILGEVYKIKRSGRTFNIEDLYLFQATAYFQQILNVKKLFQKAKINFVILKGLPLNLHYEETHPKRLYSDCDILINPKDFPRAKKIFLKQGYLPHDFTFSATHKKMKQKISETGFFKIVNNVVVNFDVHLEVVFMMTQIGSLEAFYPQSQVASLTKKFLSEKKKVRVLGEEFPLLEPENLFIYLLLHLNHHNFSGAFRFELIAKIASQKDLNYEEIAQTINFYQLNNFVYPGLILLEKYFAVRLRKEFLGKVKPAKEIASAQEKLFSKHNIFDEDTLVTAGVKRFRFLFNFSPSPLTKKLLIFLKPEVIYFVFFVLLQKSRAKLQSLLS